MTNHQIAERLVVSEGAARTHVERIMRKLGYRSRVQVATLVTEARRQMDPR
jgi:DNA-binding NarL/FixJ family response regulator